MHPVLIVGAGPVGLTAAAFLAHSGTSVRIIDANPAPTTLSKALMLWRRTLLTLSPLIPEQHWRSLGSITNTACFGDSGALIGKLDLHNPGVVQPVGAAESPASQQQQHQHAELDSSGKVHALPPAFFVTQADVEATLVGLLKDRYGVHVERNTTLSAFRVAEDSSCVQCTLVDAQTGASSEITASHLVACDGGRSTVRKQLGLTFEGSTLEQRWLLGDFSYEVDESLNPNKPQHSCEGVPQNDGLMLCTSGVGLIGIFPIAGRDGLVRILWNADSLGPPGVPSMSDFQQLISGHTRLQIRLKDILWVSQFKINERQVQSYVHWGGRLLLAGDAAHVHSPAGGQGMNTGMQDAANLAWKLALVASGEAAAGQQLLETYQEERHWVGAQVIRSSGRILRSNAVRGYLMRLVRGFALRLLLNIPFIRTSFVAMLAEDIINHPTSSLAAPAAGQQSLQRSSAGPARTASAAVRAVWGSCRPGMAFPDVSVVIGGVERPAADLLRLAQGCFATLVLMPAAAKQWQQQQEQQTEREHGSGAASAGDAATGLGSTDEAWPTMWGHCRLNVVQLEHAAEKQQQEDVPPPVTAAATPADGGGLGDNEAPAPQLQAVVDAWGLLAAAVGGQSDVGVLVRPDGIVAAVGGPADLNAWLARHIAKPSAAAG